MSKRRLIAKNEYRQTKCFSFILIAAAEDCISILFSLIKQQCIFGYEYGVS